MKAQIRYVCLNHEGQPQLDTTSYERGYSVKQAEKTMGTHWQELKSYGWKCKKLVISFQEVEL